MKRIIVISLLFCVSLYTFLPTFLFAAHVDGNLININTADVELLDTLDGIGPARAQDIIDYRTNNGLFASIGDISNVSGIGAPGSASYEKIRDHITVEESKSSEADTSTNNSSSETVVTNITQFTYESVTIQPPEDIHIRVPEAVTTTVGTFTEFALESYDATGKAITDGNVLWSFGDGSSSTGRDVGHVFHHEGVYVVVVELKKGALTDKKQITVTVVPLEASLFVPKSGEWIAILNNSTTPLDISNWRITTDYQYFIIPKNTVIKSGMEVRFPKEITKLSLLKTTGKASLKYPNGELALESSKKEEVVSLEENLKRGGTQTQPTDVEAQSELFVQKTVIGQAVPNTARSTSKIKETQEIKEESQNNQAAAIILSAPIESNKNSFYWYLALVAVLLFAIVGVLLTRQRKLVVEGYEVVEVKE